LWCWSFGAIFPQILANLVKITLVNTFPQNFPDFFGKRKRKFGTQKKTLFLWYPLDIIRKGGKKKGKKRRSLCLIKGPGLRLTPALIPVRPAPWGCTQHRALHPLNTRGQAVDGWFFPGKPLRRWTADSSQVSHWGGGRLILPRTHEVRTSPILLPKPSMGSSLVTTYLTELMMQPYKTLFIKTPKIGKIWENVQRKKKIK